VWSAVDQYIDFCSCALSKLSDFGYFDHLLEHLTGPFRVIATFGAAITIKCLLRTQGTLRRRLTYLTRATPAANTSDASGTPAPAPALAPDGVQDENPDADDMTEMKTKAYILIIRMLRQGPIKRLFGTLAGIKNGNVLEGIRECDNRFIPDSEENREDAKDAYNDWRWDVSKTFFANVSCAEQKTFDMKQAGCEDLPNGRKFYNRIKRELLKVLPEFRSSFDFVETAGKGADGTANIGAKCWVKLRTTLNKRYSEFMTGDKVYQSTRLVVRQSAAASRTAFVAAGSTSQTTMAPANMFSSAEPTRRNNRGGAPRVEVCEQETVSRPVRERPSRGTSRAASSSSAPESSSAPSGPGLERLRSNERFIPEA
jgi:hypothetical protein